MAPIHFLPILLATLAFFAVGLLWYRVLFGRIWLRAAGLGPGALGAGDPRRGAGAAVRYGLAFLFEMLVALILAHQFAMTGASDRAIMMISVGFGAFVMSPAVGLNYLFLRKPGVLFAVDAGHLVAGMAAMGAVFTAFN